MRIHVISGRDEALMIGFVALVVGAGESLGQETPVLVQL
jgi:hypothetical protein